MRDGLRSWSSLVHRTIQLRAGTSRFSSLIAMCSIHTTSVFVATLLSRYGGHEHPFGLFSVGEKSPFHSLTARSFENSRSISRADANSRLPDHRCDAVCV